MTAAMPLVVPARVVFGNVAAVTAELARASDQGSPSQAVAIDLAALTEFDSSAVSMLLELARRVRRPLSIVNPPAKLTALLELYGVSALLTDPGQVATPAASIGVPPAPH